MCSCFSVLFDVQSSIELLYLINHFSFFHFQGTTGCLTLVCIGCTSVLQCKRTVVLRSAKMRNFSVAECGKATRGNLRNVPHLIFRKLPLPWQLSAFRNPHSAKYPRPCRYYIVEVFICIFCMVRFLANVNSRSRSLYAIARPSVVCLLSVCRL